MRTNYGAMDYGNSAVLEEVVRMLLDNDSRKLRHVEEIHQGDAGVYVSVRRRNGTAREHVEVYKQVQQQRLRRITRDEKAALSQLHYKQATPEQTAKGTLDGLLRMLKGNGYSIQNATTYTAPPPFDRTPIVEVRKKSGNSSTTHLYVLETRTTYIKMPHNMSKNHQS